MERQYLVYKNLSDCSRGEWVLQSTKVGILGEAVHHHHNNLFVACLGKTHNEIHGDVCPESSWNW